MGENRAENAIINREEFPDYFPNPSDFSSEIYDWINYVKVEP